jgi:hypothetical protein
MEEIPRASESAPDIPDKSVLPAKWVGIDFCALSIVETVEFEPSVPKRID